MFSRAIQLRGDFRIQKIYFGHFLDFLHELYQIFDLPEISFPTFFAPLRPFFQAPEFVSNILRSSFELLGDHCPLVAKSALKIYQFFFFFFCPFPKLISFAQFPNQIFITTFESTIREYATDWCPHFKVMRNFVLLWWQTLQNLRQLEIFLHKILCKTFQKQFLFIRLEFA